MNRNSDDFIKQTIEAIHAGIPAQFLANRPDIRYAEYKLEASKLSVKVAKANF